MHIAFLVPYPFDRAPSQRFRFEQYLDALEEAGHTWELFPFWDEATYDFFYQRGRYVKKAWAMFKALFRRYMQLAKWSKYDVVFVHRETKPVGFPIYDWLLTHLYGNTQVFFDFDDAIWMPNASVGNKRFSFLKPYRNALKLMGWSDRVICGNAFLQEEAQKHNTNTILIPTTVRFDPNNRQEEQDPLVLGWTGSHSTLNYIEALFPILDELAKEFDFRFRLICDRPPATMPSYMEFISWKSESEQEDLLPISIGLMPLPEKAWVKGKCGLKALQYMALGMVPVVSPLGVNGDIVSDGENGRHANTVEEWKQVLHELLSDASVRRKLSLAAPKIIEEKYALAAQAPRFLALFAESK